MLSAAATLKTSLSVQIDQLRKEAEEAKKQFNYELAFVLIDQADALETQQFDEMRISIESVHVEAKPRPI